MFSASRRIVASTVKTSITSTLLQPVQSPRAKYSTVAKMPKIERITMFKIPKEEDRNKVLEQYKVLKKTATKVWQVVVQIHSTLYCATSGS